MLLNVAARPPRPPRHVRGLPAPRSCGSSRARATTTSPSRRRCSRSRISAAARGGSRSGRAASSTTAPAICGGTSEPLDRARRDPPARRAQPLERGRGGRDRARARGRPDAVRAGLRTFAGVEHRLEEVALIGGVLYVNDSKATNVASTLVALASFEAPRAPDPRRHRQGPGLHRAARPRAPRRTSSARPPSSIEREAAASACGDLATAVARARAAAARRRGRAAVAGLRELRSVRGLRGARTGIQGARRVARRYIAL